jgi:hypothetical protein
MACSTKGGRGGGGGAGRLLKYAVGLPVAFKVGMDLGNLVSPLQSHYVEDERDKKTDVWNAVGNELVEQVKTSPPLRDRLGGEAAASRVQVSDVLTLSKSHLNWQFFTHCPPTEDTSKVLCSALFPSCPCNDAEQSTLIRKRACGTR